MREKRSSSRPPRVIPKNDHIFLKFTINVGKSLIFPEKLSHGVAPNTELTGSQSTVTFCPSNLNQ